MNGITGSSAHGNGKQGNQEAGAMEKKFNEGETVRVKTNYFRKHWCGQIGIVDHCALVGSEWRYIVSFGGAIFDFDERFLTTRGVKQDEAARIRYAIWNSFTD